MPEGSPSFFGLPAALGEKEVREDVFFCLSDTVAVCLTVSVGDSHGLDEEKSREAGRIPGRGEGRKGRLAEVWKGAGAIHCRPGFRLTSPFGPRSF